MLADPATQVGAAGYHRLEPRISKNDALVRIPL